MLWFLQKKRYQKSNANTYYRQNNRVRDPENIDNFVRAGYERLYNIQQGDIWGS